MLFSCIHHRPYLQFSHTPLVTTHLHLLLLLRREVVLEGSLVMELLRLLADWSLGKVHCYTAVCLCTICSFNFIKPLSSMMSWLGLLQADRIVSSVEIKAFEKAVMLLKPSTPSHLILKLTLGSRWPLLYNPIFDQNAI